jgi:hypothetical protein
VKRPDDDRRTQNWHGGRPRRPPANQGPWPPGTRQAVGHACMAICARAPRARPGGRRPPSSSRPRLCTAGRPAAGSGVPLPVDRWRRESIQCRCGGRAGRGRGCSAVQVPATCSCGRAQKSQKESSERDGTTGIRCRQCQPRPSCLVCPHRSVRARSGCRCMGRSSQHSHTHASILYGHSDS